MKKSNKIYKAQDIRSPYFAVLVMTIFIIVGVHTLIQELYSNDREWWFVIFISVISLGPLFIIYSKFRFGVYGILSDDSVIIKNDFKITLGEIKYIEIDQIVASEGSLPDVVLVNTKGGKVIFNTCIYPTDEFINQIITKSVNCRKIDLRKYSSIIPDLLLYEKNATRENAADQQAEAVNQTISGQSKS